MKTDLTKTPITINPQQNVLTGILAGNPLALKAFYQRNWKPITHYVTTHGGTLQEAEDIFQDALVRIYQKAIENTLTIRTASIHTYFYATCKNMWYNRLRRKRKFVSPAEPMEQMDDAINPLEERELHTERYQLFTTYFQQLSPTRKQVLQLVIDGHSTKEIARTMGYTEGYTRKKKFEAKKELMEKLYEDTLYWELAG